LKGKIIKSVAGVYTVISEDDQSYTLKPKGIFRYHGINPKVGDNVDFNDASITMIEERKNSFVRPQIANVDNAILVSSLKRPDLSYELLDRFLINIEEANVQPIIVITKCDLASLVELNDMKEKMAYYSQYYPVFLSSINGIQEIDKFNSLIKGKINVVSGQTGVGKSFLLNYLSPSLKLLTQDISEALGRGKTTTRETSLFDINGTFIADTPGFSSLEYDSIKPTDLKEYYPEFVALLNECRYHQCLHINEPGCIIKEKVMKGEILKSRYASYLKIYDEIKNKKPFYKKEI